MTAVPIAVRENVARLNFLGTTSLVNAYAEQLGQDAKGTVAAVPCDGSLTFTAVTDTPLRGAIYLEDLDCIYAVFSSAVYKITYNTTTAVATVTSIGNIPGSDIVQMVRNQKATPQTGVKCAAGLYCIESDAISIINDVDLPTPVVSIAQQGGYTVYGLSDGRFFISDLNEMKNIAGTDVATAEQAPDKLVRIWADRGELFIMGQRTIEPWRNTGNADFPFETLINSTIPRGIMAADSVASLDNSFCWVGENGVVYRLDGYKPTRISTHQVERAIRASTNQSGIFGFSWSLSGHEYYTISDNATFTFSYDAATQNWHRRKSYLSDVWRHRFTLSAWSKIIVGDGNGGSLYYFDSNTFTEAGDPMFWTVKLPAIHVFPNGGICHSAQFDMAVGYGLASPTAQGYNPQAILNIYKDGGNTVAISRLLPLGRRGEYKTRVNTSRLGRFRDKGLVLELTITDPVARSIVLADAKIQPLLT